MGRIWAVEIQRWMKPAEHSQLFVRAVFLLHATVLWCRGQQCLSHGSLHIWSTAGAVEAHLFSGWRLLLSLQGGQIPQEVEWAQSARQLRLMSRAELTQKSCFSEKLSGLLGSMSTVDSPRLMPFQGYLGSCDAQTDRISLLSDGAASASCVCWKTKVIIMLKVVMSYCTKR